MEVPAVLVHLVAHAILAEVPSLNPEVEDPSSPGDHAPVNHVALSFLEVDGPSSSPVVQDPGSPLVLEVPACLLG